jgi:hypothetical protein
MDDHVAQHNDASDALAAIQYKVGESGTGASHTLWYKAEHVDTDQIVDGAVTREKLLAAVENLLVPAGTVQDFAGETVPTGWLSLEGQTVANADTLYPELWAIAPSAWKSGTSIILADARGKYFYHGGTSDTVGSVIGSDSYQLTAAPGHGHSANAHTHTVNSAAFAHNHPYGHSHNLTLTAYYSGNNVTTFNYNFNSSANSSIWNNSTTTFNTTPSTNTNSSATSNTIFPGAHPGSSASNSTNHTPVTLPISYIVFKKIIKVH